MTCTHGTKSGRCAHCQEIAHEVKLAVAEMKERCAKVAEDEADKWRVANHDHDIGAEGAARDIAIAIRSLKDEP